MQATLLGHEPPGFDLDFGSIRHHELGAGAWIDHRPGWVRGHQALFEDLERSLDWHQGRREMYDQVVDVPRLTATLPDDGPGHPLLAEIATALGERYCTRLRRIHLALYRDGRDSVAWHGDRVGRVTDTTVVGIVSLGAPRRFLLRPKAGGRSRRWSLGWGDLLVMGGTCQRTFEHTVPKVAHADPRMSVMFREQY